MGLVVLDTSVLIVDWQPRARAAVSTVPIGELHAWVELAAHDPPEEPLRRQRLEGGRRAARRPRRRSGLGALLALSRRTQGPRNQADLLIAASAVAYGAGLATVDRRLAAHRGQQ